MLLTMIKRRLRSRLGTAALACLTLATLGCGRGEVLGKVSGQVKFQGQPVTEGVILFSNAEKGVHITADLNKDGRYVVEMAKGYGLPLGDYQVTISPPLPDTPPVGPIPKVKVKEYPDIPPKYRRAETSGLTMTVRAGENPFDVDMQP